MKRFILILSTCLVFGAGYKESNGSNSAASETYAVKEKSLARSNDPQLFFSRADLPALREKVKSAPDDEFYGLVQHYADRFMNLAVDPYETDGPYSGRNLQAHVGVLAFTGWINNDEKYINKAKEVFLAALNQWTVQDIFGFNGHLSLGDAGWAYAVSYDWLAAFMSEDERALAKSKMHELGESLLHDSVKTPRSGSPEPVGSLKRERVAHNHQVVNHVGLMLLGMLLDEQERVDYSKARLQGYMRYTQDGTGAPFEGTGYLEYGLSGCMFAGAAYERRYGEDLYKGIKGVDQILNHMMHQLAPWGGEVVPICQTDYGQSAPVGYFCLSQQLKDSLGLWTWRRVLGKKGVGFLKDPDMHTSHLKMLPFFVLWSDASVKPKSPSEAGAPLSALFRRGQASMRSGWDDEATLVTFNAGEGMVGIWDHPDETQFTFYSEGSKFILDCGAYMFGPGSHGVMMVDGKGQVHVGAGHSTQGRITAFEDRGDSVFVAGDATDAYTRDVYGKGVSSPICHVKRQLLFVRASEPFLVVVDDVEANDFSEHRFTSRLFYADKYTPNSVALGEHGAFRINGTPSGAVAEVKCLWPENVSLNEGRFEGNNGRFGKYVDITVSGESVRMISVITASKTAEKLPEVKLTPSDKDIAFTVDVTFTDAQPVSVYIDQQYMKTR